MFEKLFRIFSGTSPNVSGISEGEKTLTRCWRWMRWPTAIYVLLGLFSIYEFSAYAGCNSPCSFERVFGVLLAVAIGSFLAGGLFGVIFGLPRSNNEAQRPQNQNNTQQGNASRFKNNTSLEEVSDWLTKIILGSSLTQLPRIHDEFTHIVRRLADGIGAPNIDSSKSIVAALILFSFLFGFLEFYVITRVFLRILFDDAENSPSIDDARKILAGGIEYDMKSDKPIANLSDISSKEKDAVLEINPDSLTTVDDLQAWSRVQIDAGRYSTASTGYERALKLDPENALLLLEHASVLRTLKNNRKALTQLEKAVANIGPDSSPEDIRRIYEGLIFCALYEPNNGFRTAISSGEEYLTKYPGIKTSRYWLLMAAAYGQFHKYLRGMNANPDLVNDTRNKALAAAETALKLDSSWKPILQEMWNPKFEGKNPEENDLESFYDPMDASFKKLLQDT